MKENLITCLKLYVAAIILIAVYNLALNWIGKSFWPEQTYGSLIKDESGAIRGSYLLNTEFNKLGYFKYRPQMLFPSQCNVALYTTKFKNALNSLQHKNHDITDVVMITPSASTHDPYILKNHALDQVTEISQYHQIDPEILEDMIEKLTINSSFPFFALDIINVTKLNFALMNFMNRKASYQIPN